jgi:predicted methyltransferase
MAPEAFAEMARVLKPGGILGVVEHRGTAKPQDPRAVSGYVNEEYAIAMIEAAGFELVARSGINDNPKDTKDYEQGVWTLPPDYRLGNRDRAKYQAISRILKAAFRAVGVGGDETFVFEPVQPEAGASR